MPDSTALPDPVGTSGEASIGASVDGPTAAPGSGRPRRVLGLSLTAWVVVATLAGAAVGALWPGLGAKTPGFDGGDLKVISDVFIRAIKMVVAPILVATLVLGLAGPDAARGRSGRLAVRTFAWFFASTTLALLFGLAAVLLFRPGDDPALHAALAAVDAADLPALAAPRTLLDHVRELVPTSAVDALARNDVLQIVVFSLVFGAALARVEGRGRVAVVAFLEGLAETMFRVVGFVMALLPAGVFAAMAVAVAQGGLGVLRPLLVLVATVYAGLAAFVLLVLWPLLRLARVPLGRFGRAVREPVLIAFTTTSSDAALPLAMQRLTAFGVPRRIVAFVLSTGLSFNLAGSTLYLAVATLFVAQAAGVPFGAGKLALLTATLALTTKGIAAVPRASLVILSGTLAAFGLPLEGIALILGVDQAMDMARTGVNTLGNTAAAAALARWEGEAGWDDGAPDRGGVS